MCSQGTVGLRRISCVCVGISVLPLVTMVARTALAPAAPFSCHRKVSSQADIRVAQLSLFLPSVCLGYRKTKSVPCIHALRASSEGATRHPPRLIAVRRFGYRRHRSALHPAMQNPPKFQFSIDLGGCSCFVAGLLFLPTNPAEATYNLNHQIHVDGYLPQSHLAGCGGEGV